MSSRKLSFIDTFRGEDTTKRIAQNATADALTQHLSEAIDHSQMMREDANRATTVTTITQMIGLGIIPAGQANAAVPGLMDDDGVMDASKLDGAGARIPSAPKLIDESHTTSLRSAVAPLRTTKNSLTMTAPPDPGARPTIELASPQAGAAPLQALIEPRCPPDETVFCLPPRTGSRGSGPGVPSASGLYR